MDTPVVNGTAYPTLTVAPRAYRFRVLDAAHDRFFNLQWYVAADNTAGTTAEATTAGLTTRVCDGSVAADRCTEVKMVPASPATPGFPPNWPMDGRVGGVPDPALVGPSFIQIGTEGGFLPMPVVVPNQPIAWNLNPTTFNFGNVEDHSLLLGPAERADVIVDFCAYAGKTLVLYNDAPAAFPALDPRNDYLTGAPDLTAEGGVFTPLPGYGPNVRTIMQVKVVGTCAAPYDVNALMTAWAPVVTTNPPSVTPGVFQRAQDPIIVGQTAYNEAYSTTFPQFYPTWGIARITDRSMSFQTTTGALANLTFKPKAIHDEMGAVFDDYGRSSPKLGLELPNPTPTTRNFVMQGYADPPTELVMLSNPLTPIGLPGADGTQIWKITHNGVDTHPIHFHLFHVQLINRVGWDGAIRLPDPSELGWKDTLRISPLEDTIVALRPIAPDPARLPWPVPNSFRALNPTEPLGSSIGFSGLDPLGNAVTVFNNVANFGWEYVWHAHILSHEENDMMRPLVLAVAPGRPTGLTATVTGTGSARRAVLRWTEPDAGVPNKTGYTLQRSTDPTFQTGLTTFPPLGLVTTLSDPIGNNTTPLFYRVAATNTVGSTVPGFPMMTATSDWSLPAAVSASPSAPAVPTNLGAVSTGTTAPQVTLTWNDTSNNETGFQLQRATNSAFTTGLTTIPLAANMTTYVDNAVFWQRQYFYRVRAVNASGNSPYSNIANVTLPANPSGLVLAMNFNEGGGDTTQDLSRNGNSGTVSGGAERGNFGRFGRAIRFDGRNDMVNVANSASLQLTGPLTLEAWVRPSALAGVNGASGWRTIIMKERTTTGLSYALYGNDGNTNPARPAGYLRIASIDQPIAAPPELLLNAWTHVAVTYDGATFALYVNGQLRTSRQLAGAVVTSTNPLRIGGNSVFSGEYFAGIIDDVRIYSRALTAAQIVADMNTPVR
jgi:FtsP/CotA-like multicopper oxidase with cupredoxin domain